MSGSISTFGWARRPPLPRDRAPEPLASSQGWGNLAERQSALVTGDQLLALGIGPGPIQYALQAGRLYRKHPGVYALVGPAALPPLATERAALLACGEQAYLSHGSAAAIWGFRDRPPSKIDVTVVGRKSGRQPAGMTIHSTRHLAQIDRRLHKGLRIVSPARTLLDIASSLDGREPERALERDHRRDTVLQQMGFLVIRILARELLMAPERVLVRLARALALRGTA